MGDWGFAVSAKTDFCQSPILFGNCGVRGALLGDRVHAFHGFECSKMGQAAPIKHQMARLVHQMAPIGRQMAHIVRLLAPRICIWYLDTLSMHGFILSHN